jgi:spore maturation protein SpmA
MKWMDDYNQRRLDRAEQILRPEQWKLYREFQEQQATMQKFALNMARQMLGGDKTASPPESAPAK